MIVHEEIELFGGPERLFGCRHVPLLPAGAGVVICSSGPFDGGVDEPRGARLGRRLAEAGVAVQRFDYRGTPPSDGDPAAITFASMVDDARRALDLLRDRCPVDRLGFLGMRLGALVAARLARAHDGAPLAVWQPAIDPRGVLEHAARARAAGAGADGADGGSTLVDDAPALDLFETPLAADLFDGGIVGSVLDELGNRPRRVLVLQTGPGAELRPEYVSLANRGRAMGLVVDIASHPCDGERAGVPVPITRSDRLVADTAAWLAARLAADDPAPPAHDAPPADDNGQR